jgi:hypothetical protein
MALKIAGHLFTGPLKLTETRIRANQIPVVYAIICKFGQPWDPRFRLIDVGESGGQNLDFSTHARLSEWETASDGELSVYFLYMSTKDGYSAEDRQRIADQLRQQYDPPKGVMSVAAGV